MTATEITVSPTRMLQPVTLRTQSCRPQALQADSESPGVWSKTGPPGYLPVRAQVTISRPVHASGGTRGTGDRAIGGLPVQ